MRVLLTTSVCLCVYDEYISLPRSDFPHLLHPPTVPGIPVYDFAELAPVHVCTRSPCPHARLSTICDSVAPQDLETSDTHSVPAYPSPIDRCDVATQASPRRGGRQCIVNRFPHDPMRGGDGFAPSVPPVPPPAYDGPPRIRGRPRTRTMVGEGIMSLRVLACASNVGSGHTKCQGAGQTGSSSLL